MYEILPGLLYENYLSQVKSPEQELKVSQWAFLFGAEMGLTILLHVMPTWDTESWTFS